MRPYVLLYEHTYKRTSRPVGWGTVPPEIRARCSSSGDADSIRGHVGSFPGRVVFRVAVKRQVVTEILAFVFRFRLFVLSAANRDDSLTRRNYICFRQLGISNDRMG